MSDPRLRVVIVTYAPGPALAACLDSLSEAVSEAYHVVLADNGSPADPLDADVARAARRPEVRLVRTGGNIGYGRAANLGALLDAEDRPQWIAVVNPDLVFHPGALDELLAAGARWPHAGVLGPAILTPGGDLYPSARALPSLVRGAGHAVLGWWWPANPFTAGYRNEAGAPREGAVGWLSGSCLLVRGHVFAEVGGFDPAYFMYFEDLDFCERVGRWGAACVYVPTAVVTHTGGHATRANPTRMALAHHRSAWIYLSRRYAGARYLPVRAVLAGGLLVRLGLSLAVRRIATGAAPTRSAASLTAGQPPASIPGGEPRPGGPPPSGGRRAS